MTSSPTHRSDVPADASVPPPPGAVAPPADTSVPPPSTAGAPPVGPPLAPAPAPAGATPPVTERPVTERLVAERPVGATSTGAPTTSTRAAERDDRVERTEQVELVPTDAARDKFGGVNLGACLFGWIVAVGVSVILTGILGAVAAAVGDGAELTQTDAERSAGTIGLAAAIAVLVVLVLGYYCGGYVAGRMSRFDGARQGIAVWVIGLVLTLVAVGIGAIWGTQYDAFDRVDLPRVYLSDDQLGWGTALAGLAILVGTAVAAWFGGILGRRYHSRVDRVAGRAWEDAAAHR